MPYFFLGSFLVYPKLQMLSFVWLPNSWLNLPIPSSCVFNNIDSVNVPTNILFYYNIKCFH